MRATKRPCGLWVDRLAAARDRAAAIAESNEYLDFVELVRAKTPGRFNGNKELGVFLRRVDQHLEHFVPRLLASVDRDIHEVFDFGCGTGASSVALAMVFPEVQCHGTDINRVDLSIAHARARLYGVSERCHFDYIGEDQPLPTPGDRFDLCVCCSVLEYVTGPKVRKFCVQEMARILAPGGLLFMTVPNRLYPFEIHSRKLGWNYFPKLLKARIVGSSAWEVKNLARPYSLKLHRTPPLQLFVPWTNFCLKKEC
jgi:ubiquinone/menaquinone biosynthesis C-methylase UbiE